MLSWPAVLDFKLSCSDYLTWPAVLTSRCHTKTSLLTLLNVATSGLQVPKFYPGLQACSQIKMFWWCLSSNPSLILPMLSNESRVTSGVAVNWMDIIPFFPLSPFINIIVSRLFEWSFDCCQYGLWIILWNEIHVVLATFSLLSCSQFRFPGGGFLFLLYLQRRTLH